MSLNGILGGTTVEKFGRGFAVLFACGLLGSCASSGGGVVIPDCFKTGCAPGLECKTFVGTIGFCVPVATPTPPPPTPTPSPSASPTPTPVPTPGPTATPTATPTPPPAPTPTPQPSPTPCTPQAVKACFTNEPNGPLDPPDWRYEKPLSDCWNVQTWTGYMVNHGYWTAGDPAEDGGDVWLNTAVNGSFECYSKRTVDRVSCSDHSRVTTPNWQMFPPFVRTVTKACPATPTPQPTPSASPTPGPTPTPGPGGCPPLLKVGGMFLSAVDCGNCRRQGYLGWRVNYTSTELCREGDPGCVCDPARDRCEMPRSCQNPEGADIRITLASKFTNDLCDANSDNAFNCHHKPKADEAGITLFTSMPKGETDFYSSRTVTNCVEIQAGSVRQLDRERDQRCKDALKAAGR